MGSRLPRQVPDHLGGRLLALGVDDSAHTNKRRNDTVKRIERGMKSHGDAERIWPERIFICFPRKHWIFIKIYDFHD